MERSLDSHLWHACAGDMVQMPAVNSRVFYFPQGHAEHACGPVDFSSCERSLHSILCRVLAIKFMADPETDEVYAKIKLIPVSNNEPDLDDDGIGVQNTETQDKPASFAKKLTQSDADSGRFFVPRHCEETIFPRIEDSSDPPEQTILAKDVHGEIWKFRYDFIRKHSKHLLLTTGWSNFVKHKKLFAGDAIVFLRAENEDLCVGIRRAKRGVEGGPEVTSGWNANYANYNLLRNAHGNVDGSTLNNRNNLMGKGKVRPESVIDVVRLAAARQPFEVVYYPRAGAEFCVKASLVKAALQIEWCSGMRFKMGYETEDSRISWFVGTISSVEASDPLDWPDSPWRLLQVTWHNPDYLHNVKCVSPWVVKLVHDTPPRKKPRLPPRKKPRLPQQPDFSLDCQLPIPSFSGTFGSSGQFPAGFPPIDHTATSTVASNSNILQKPGTGDNVSTLLTMSHSTQTSQKADDINTHRFVLFGQQISPSCAGDTVSPVLTGNSSSEGNFEKLTNFLNVSGSSLLQHGLGLPEGSSREADQCDKDS